MLRYTIALLLGLAKASQPISMEDDGINSIQLFLKRESAMKPSRFYYPMTIHG